jgi:hypothetical protein
MQRCLQESPLNRKYANPFNTCHRQCPAKCSYDRRTSLVTVAISYSSKGNE